MENPASLQDVIDNFERPLTAPEAAVVPAWLNTAWSRFRKAIAGVAVRVDLPEDDPSYIDVQDVSTVLAEMVIRRLRNPDGLRTWNDDTYGQTVDSELSSGRIYITADEIAQFAVPGTGISNGMYSIPLSRF